MNQFHLDIISKYRTELMGLSAIGVLCCHAVGNNVLLPSYVNKIMVLGQLGVNIFFFLSGVGIWYSLQNIENIVCCNNYILWYKNRYIKLFVPYLLLAIPFYAYFTIIKNENLKSFLSIISTFEYWVSGRGTWFISVLIILYFISPWYERLLTYIPCKFSFSVIIFIIIIIFGMNNIKHSSEISFYFLGFGTAPYIKYKKVIQWIPLCICSLISYIIFRKISILQIYPRSIFLVPSFIIIPCLYFNSCNIKIFIKCCNFMGHISLESYLTNVFLPWIFIKPKFIYNNHILGYGNYIGYILVIIIGIILSVIVHKISAYIIEKIKENENITNKTI